MKTIGAAIRAVVQRPAVWIPAALLMAATLVFWTTDLDVALVRPFFSGYVVTSPRDGGVREFPLQWVQPWKGLYNWGEYPALILAGGGVAVWMASFLWKRLKPCRNAGLFYFLLLLIGPGIMVNCVFKPFWSRPRPQATVAFGGEREFLPVLQRGYGADDSSFPSGHAAVGFYLMAPAFVYWRRRPWLALAFVLFGLAAGAVIGLARMVAGGHFPSDVLWAGGIVYFTALALAVPFRFGRE